MAHVRLAAQPRLELGNGPARRLRRQGLIPGVVYQKGQDSILMALPERELRRLLHGDGARSAVIELTVGEAPALTTLVKDWQVEPVRGDLLHVDLQQVDLTVKFRAPVSVVLTGEPVGVREGGVLDQTVREVTVEALPDDLPDSIEHDVSGLDVGDVFHVGDLRVPAGVEIVDDPETVVASILSPSVIVEEEEAEEAAAAEEALGEPAPEEPAGE
jgi:large subunit ribosomal protein L25